MSRSECKKLGYFPGDGFEVISGDNLGMIYYLKEDDGTKIPKFSTKNPIETNQSDFLYIDISRLKKISTNKSHRFKFGHIIQFNDENFIVVKQKIKNWELFYDIVREDSNEDITIIRNVPEDIL